jgi:hypothetical protein
VGLRTGLNVEGRVGLRTGLNVEGRVGLRTGLNVEGRVGLRKGLDAGGRVGLRKGLDAGGRVGLRKGLNVEGRVSLRKGLNVEGRVGLRRQGGSQNRTGPSYESFSFLPRIHLCRQNTQHCSPFCINKRGTGHRVYPRSPLCNAYYYNNSTFVSFGRTPLMTKARVYGVIHYHFEPNGEI